MSRIGPERLEPGVQKPIPVRGMALYQRFEKAMVAAFKVGTPQRDDAEFSARKPHPEVNRTGLFFEQGEGERVEADGAAEEGSRLHGRGGMLVPEEPEAAAGVEVARAEMS